MTSTPRFILGISAYYHDSAACLLRDGEIVAAGVGGALHAQEGRRRVPDRGRRRTASARPASRSRDLAAVGFYDKPLLKFERILETYLGVAPRGLRQLPQGGPALGEGKALHRPRASRGHRPLADRAARTRAYDGELLYAEHHEIATRRARSSRRRSRKPRSSRWTASASGRRRRSASAAAPTSRSSRSCTGRTRSACSTRRSPTTPASR